MSASSRRVDAWLLSTFVLSGLAGLIYQSIWTQYLGLFLGHSSHAQSLVLMLFMGGMAIGAWLASRHTGSFKKPLLAYAIVEVIIGVLGLSFDGLYQGITGMAYESWLPALQGGGQGLRWLLAIALVLPQCILLGATFPLMSAGYMRLQPGTQGQVLSGLYFSNSMGAAVGALASTYLLLPAVGLPGTVMTAGLLNIVVAIAVYPLARNPAAAADLGVGASNAATADTSEGAPTSRALWVVLLIALLTGASSFVYEIAWVRMLSLALGTTLHSFEIMLAAFITGIAMGGLWLRKRADRMADPLRVAGWVQVLMGLAALASLFVYLYAFEWVGWLMRTLVRSTDGYTLYNLASGVISILVMFPAAFCAGMTLPLLTLALLRAGRGERSIGQAYASNTLGAIVGVLAAVHVLMPLLGLRNTVVIAALVDVGLGVWLLWPARVATTHRAAPRSMVPAAGAAAVLGIAGALAAVIFIRFDPMVLSSSVFRSGATKLDETANMLFYRDGTTATVSMYETKVSGGQLRAIATNGKVDAGMAATLQQRPSGDESTMVLLGALPLALRDDYKRVGIIGFGSGLSTHTVLGDARVGEVETVEIEPAMIEGAKLFGDRVARAFTDPRSHIVIDDAKAWFAASPRRYDLIISEPSNPWMGGVASLFSEEFYRFVPRHLEEGGIFVQWLQMYEISPDLVASVLQGMLASFEDVHAYLANNGDLILVAVPKGKVPEVGDALFSQKALSEELARVGVHGVQDLRDIKVMDRAALEAFVPLYPAPANSDFFPYLRLQAPTARFRNASVEDFNRWRMVPWTVRESLGQSAPQARGLQDERTRLPVSGIQMQWSATELAQVLSGMPPIERRHATREAWADTQALRGQAQACELEATPRTTINRVLSVAAQTLAYLPVDERRALWSDHNWLQCPLREPGVIAALDLAAASARGDHAQVLEQGKALFGSVDGPALLADKLSGYYVFGAMQHAAWALGDTARSRQLTEQYWSRLSPEARGDGSLRLLSYMASLGPAPGQGAGAAAAQH